MPLSRPSNGLIIAAPSSGCGKTVITLGILKALKLAGHRVASAKVGPDYIDTAYHTVATGRPSYNLDSWAMRPKTLLGLCTSLDECADLIICEGAMGLFDGANSGVGSTADVSALTGWPVILVVDVSGQAASAAAVIQGFVNHRPDIDLLGVIFNRVGGPSHRHSLETATLRVNPEISILGFVPRNESLYLPERHLGLVQVAEQEDFLQWLDTASSTLSIHIDLAQIANLARPRCAGFHPPQTPLPPLGQHIAIADDPAFSFTYNSVLEGWRRQNAEISFFSPLYNEAPAQAADSVYLPGGYPELHAAKLSSNHVFLEGLRAAATKAFIYGECGGYMVLGKTLTDKAGKKYPMANLLPLETTFSDPKLQLGYRRAKTTKATPFGPKGGEFNGHEFHYCRAIGKSPPADALFECEDSTGNSIGQLGMLAGQVAGSFIHLIDRAK